MKRFLAHWILFEPDRSDSSGPDTEGQQQGVMTTKYQVRYFWKKLKYKLTNLVYYGTNNTVLWCLDSKKKSASSNNVKRRN